MAVYDLNLLQNIAIRAKETEVEWVVQGDIFKLRRSGEDGCSVTCNEGNNQYLR